MQKRTKERTAGETRLTFFPPKKQLHFELCIFSLTGNYIRDRKKKEGKNYDTWKLGKHSKMLKKMKPLHYIM